MSNKQARLVAAIADAMEAQGISQSALGRKTGVPQSMISAAMLGKYDLKEEKWRMICEALALDYDEIIADTETVEAEAPGQACEQEDEQETEDVPEDVMDDLPEDAVEDVPDDLLERSKRCIDVVTRYIVRKLREDVSKGTDMPLDELYILLDVCSSAEKYID
ncbi:MAG: helix-turn-helix domain-containing protein [Aristaeellaceae bacterium]